MSYLLKSISIYPLKLIFDQLQQNFLSFTQSVLTIHIIIKIVSLSHPKMEMGIQSNVSKQEMGTEKPFMLGSLYPLCTLPMTASLGLFCLASWCWYPARCQASVSHGDLFMPGHTKEHNRYSIACINDQNLLKVSIRDQRDM